MEIQSIVKTLFSLQSGSALLPNTECQVPSLSDPVSPPTGSPNLSSNFGDGTLAICKGQARALQPRAVDDPLARTRPEQDSQISGVPGTDLSHLTLCDSSRKPLWKSFIRGIA